MTIEVQAVQVGSGRRFKKSFSSLLDADQWIRQYNLKLKSASGKKMQNVKL